MELSEAQDRRRRWQEVTTHTPCTPPPTVSLLLLLHHVSAVIFAPHHGEFDPGQVLCPTPLHKHHVVLLQVVPLPGNEHHRLLPVGQPHAGALPVGGVGLLGLSDHRLQDDRLQLGAAKRGSNGFGRDFGLPLAMHLVERGHGPGQEGGGPCRGVLGRCRGRGLWLNTEIKSALVHLMSDTHLESATSVPVSDSTETPFLKHQTRTSVRRPSTIS